MNTINMYSTTITLLCHKVNIQDTNVIIQNIVLTHDTCTIQGKGKERGEEV